MTPKQFFTGRAVGLIIVIVVILLVAAFYAFNNYIYEQKQAYAAKDYKNAEYVIDGERVRLTDGVAEAESPKDSAMKIVTRYFGNEIRSDLDEDGREDVVFLLTQQLGGTGTFYYAVAALNTERGYVGSEAILIGDRIAPQTTEKGSGKIIVVNYADRAPGEPFTTAPSVGKSLRLIFDPTAMQFGEVASDFEGEADPSRMTLGMKTWTWVSALYNDGREIKPGPGKTNSFTVTFGSDGKFTAKTDCNSMGGSYVADSKSKTISFSQIFSTKMYCEGSQEGDFSKLLENASAYHFTSKGELILDLKFDSGTATFR